MKNGWRLPIVGAGLILLLTVLAYLPVMRGGFIWDDDALITDNRMVKANDGLRRIWLTAEAPDWRLTSSAWWLEWRLWGNHPTGYHAANVLLHGINAVLVWAILWRLKVPGAWLAGCVFALHPVNVGTVAWISEQKNTLSMLFYTIAILLYLQFDEEGGWRWYGLSLAAFLLALLSKTAVVMLPVVLLGCVWWLRGRVRRKDLLRSLPFFVLSLVMGLVTVWYQYSETVGRHAIRTEGFFTRLAVAGLTPWFYLCKTLLPIDLMVIYPKWDVGASLWSSFAPGIILVGCLTLFWWRRKSWGRPLFFGLGYFVVTLFPVSGFFHQTFHMHSFVADHWLYHSIAGVIALAVAGGVEICRRMGDRGRYWGTTAAVAVLTAIGVATWGRACVYAADETLWRDTLAKNPKAWVAQLNLGNAVQRAGRIQDAMGHYEQALQIKPDYAEAHLDLGAALIRLGRPEDAIRHYEQALEIDPDAGETHRNLGVGLEQVGRVTEAISCYEEALRINPDSAEAHNDLGNAFLRLGKLPEAIEQYQQALKFTPDSAATHNNLGDALFRQGRVEQAISCYTEALRITPGSAVAHNNLGAALIRQGKREDAIAHYEQALQLKPDYAEAHYNLATALLAMGNSREAAKHLEWVLQINPGSVEAHYRLAEILEQTGRLREATEHYELALRFRPDYPGALNNLAWLLATREPAESTDPGRAVALAERACKLSDHPVATYLDTLAAAYAAAGRFDDAIAAAEKATELARAEGQSGVAEKIEGRLQLYRNGHAYRQSAGVTP
jgi:tetratricopeptide (TPR) repeat protein